jgi:hypothetical protein
LNHVPDLYLCNDLVGISLYIVGASYSH